MTQVPTGDFDAGAGAGPVELHVRGELSSDRAKRTGLSRRWSWLGREPPSQRASGYRARAPGPVGGLLAHSTSNELWKEPTPWKP
jgi:hypothetical protein